MLSQAGITDLRFMNAVDPTHRGCAFFVPIGRAGDLPARTASRWGQLAVHVAASCRIRRRLRQWAADRADEKPEAILEPDGKLSHAEVPAQGRAVRDALRRAVVGIDRARGPLRRRDQDEALEAWQGLVAGRWSLLDQFDSDGRRFVVAHRNDPSGPDLRGLTLRERQVMGFIAAGHANKEIAYALGLSTSTVATHAARARAKLGLPSWRAICGEGSGEARPSSHSKS